ncbi:AzlC family ABC transporter permease [Gordonia sp. (in: high G+C Gram-positive bacteria)]|uniref:AzlC family ABC transporter permease n=1 Tax=Gordonia sp. (in: high G+C Gram-positive bacteria) TaxID=84139 RepID=UPI003C72F639
MARQDVMRGLRLTIPLMLGYLPVAFAFGVLAEVFGLPVWASLLMSAIVYGGASQFAALQVLASGGGMFAVISTTFVVNLRHFLLAASIAPRVKDYSTKEAAAFGAQLTDEAYVIQEVLFRAHERRPKAEVFALNMGVYASWIAGTALGIVFGSAVPGIEDIGLEFALTAMFLAILAQDAVRSRLDLFVALVGGGVAVLLTQLGLELWSVVLATVFAATVGFCLDRTNDEPVDSPVGETS